MNIVVKETGVQTTAQYITTKSGNKRLSVDGKTYTDKKFNDTFYKVIDDQITFPLFQYVRKFKKGPEECAKILSESIFSTYKCWYHKGFLTVYLPRPVS